MGSLRNSRFRDAVEVHLRWILDTPDFVRVAYTTRERISSDGEFAEWTRRVVLVKSP